MNKKQFNYFVICLPIIIIFKKCIVAVLYAVVYAVFLQSVHNKK